MLHLLGNVSVNIQMYENIFLATNIFTNPQYVAPSTSTGIPQSRLSSPIITTTSTPILTLSVFLDATSNSSLGICRHYIYT